MFISMLLDMGYLLALLAGTVAWYNFSWHGPGT